MKIIESKYNLKTNKINNISIIHISDIHYDSFYNVERLKLIIENVSKNKPNYVCITGDILDNNEVLKDDKTYKIIYDFFNQLCLITKVIITLGNHELKGNSDYSTCYYDILIKLKRIPNIILLDNELLVENNICFVGFNPSYDYYKKKGRDYNILNKDFDSLNLKIDKNNYNILLIHTPKDLLSDNIYNNRFNKFDLILAGHTHGGLMPVKLFGHRGIISPGKRLFPKDVRGKLTRENTNLIICSGVMRLSNSAGFFHHFNFLYKIHINHISISKN